MKTASNLFVAGGLNERGMALILVLSMLTIMSLLGVLALSTATTELNITGNMRSSRESFFAAERAIDYASIAGDIYESIGTNTVPLTTGQANDIKIDHGGYTSGIDASEKNLDDQLVNQVGYLTSGPLPPSSGSDATLFEMRYYRISVTGHGPNNSSTRIEAQVGRLVPK
jgi:PilX N-terminal